jgi:hypothetical protein
MHFYCLARLAWEALSKSSKQISDISLFTHSSPHTRFVFELIIHQNKMWVMQSSSSSDKDDGAAVFHQSRKMVGVITILAVTVLAGLPLFSRMALSPSIANKIGRIDATGSYKHDGPIPQGESPAIAWLMTFPNSVGILSNLVPFSQ